MEAPLQPRDVDTIIDKFQLLWSSKRASVKLARLFLEIDAAQWTESLATLDAIAGTDAMATVVRAG